MSREQQNLPAIRPALVLTSQTTNPIPSGSTGLWYDGTSFWRVNADGSLVATSTGVVPSARVAFSVNPTANDTLGIGGSTFTFKSSLGAATTTTQVKILGTPALTLAALLDAINGVTNANVVPNTTPFAASIVADAVTATVLRIRKASSQGGTAVPGTVSTTALTASISGGASAWNCANLNVSGLYPKLTITSGMITNGSFDLELSYTPQSLVWQGCASSGVPRAVNEAVTISGNTIHLAFAGGASPNWQSTDVFSFFAAS